MTDIQWETPETEPMTVALAEGVRVSRLPAAFADLIESQLAEAEGDFGAKLAYLASDTAREFIEYIADEVWVQMVDQVSERLRTSLIERAAA